METLTNLLGSNGVQDSVMKSVTGMMSDGTLSLSKLEEHADRAGLSDVSDSWVGTGDNKPISADQLKQVADPENLQAIADKSGVTVDEAAEELSKALPDAVDKLTPNGVLPSDEEVKSAVSATT
jgi:uncharacterized protein YidB (DUF937 family)